MNGTDILVTAIEGGIGYWADVEAYSPANGLATIRDAEEGHVFKLTAGELTAAAKKVVELYPTSIGAEYIRQEDIDAEAADMIVQVACFGEVVYG